MRSVAVLLAFAMGLVAARSSADTPMSVWQRAASPKAATVERVHAAVEAKLIGLPSNRQLDLEDARSQLEAAFSAGIEAPILHYDLAQIYFAQKRFQPTLRELQTVLESRSPDVSVANVWGMLAMSYAHLEDHQNERDAHREHLRHTKSDGARAVTTMNLAESEMALGHLEEAVAQYREAERIAGQSQAMSSVTTHALCVWGLSVALDRMGDRAQSLSEAERANTLDPGAQILTGDGVFFAPPYERDWYLALSLEARAARATGLEHDRHIAAAAAYYRSYVNRALASAHEDRWLELAKKRASKLEKETDQAAKRRKTKKVNAPNVIELETVI